MGNTKFNLIAVFIIIVSLFLSVFIFSGVYAFGSSNKGNFTSDLKTQYAPGEELYGWINISLTNEPYDSILTAFNNSIPLLDFLKIKNKLTVSQYNCSTLACGSTYSSSDLGSDSKSFSINSGENKTLGFKISDTNLDSVAYLGLTISSNASESCSAQLKIDIGNDGIYDWMPSRISSGSYCSNPDYGCYSSSSSFSIMTQDTSYCQNINLSQVNGLLVGANVSGNGIANFSFRLDNEHTCYNSISSSGIVSCEIKNLSFFETQTHELCIKRISGASYNLYYKQNNPSCNENLISFSMFVQPIKYSAIDSFFINSTNLGSSFASIVDDYLEQTYLHDCSSNCYIPITFYSGLNSQAISINNISLLYDVSYGNTILSLSQNKIYELNNSKSKINMPFTKLNLSGSGLKAPLKSGNYNLSLKLDNYEILKQAITVLDLPILTNLYPLEVPAGIKTYFTVTSQSNLTEYTWNFGDNSSLFDSSSNRADHVYSQIGKYNITITATNNQGSLSKTFNISVVSPKDYLPTIFNSYKRKINSLRNQTNNLSPLAKNYLENKLNLTSMENNLNSIMIRYNSSNLNTSDYISMARSLLNFDLPDSIVNTGVASGRFIMDKSKINLDTLKSVTYETIAGSEEILKESIFDWFIKSIIVEESYTNYAILVDNSSSNVFSDHTFVLSAKSGIKVDKVYTIIIEPRSKLFFGESISSSLISSNSSNYVAFSFDLSSGQKTFDFLIEDNINLLDMPIYFSPSLSKLSIIKNLTVCNFNDKCEKNMGEDSSNCRADCFPVGKSVIGLIIALIIFFIAYIIAQEWYKRRYEDYLFKDKNDLFNLIHFVSNAEKQGLKREEIFDKLKEMEWGSEQIIYAYKKFHSQRTGMWEIPIFRFFENKKVARELNLRNKLGINPKAVPKPNNLSQVFGKNLEESKKLPFNPPLGQTKLGSPNNFPSGKPKQQNQQKVPFPPKNLQESTKNNNQQNTNI
jgi:PKD repeat protein